MDRLEHVNRIRINALIIGAGNLGEMILRELERNKKYKYNVVGFIDDDPQKLGAKRVEDPYSHKQSVHP